MVSKAKFALMKRFFETIASRVKHVYDIENRDLGELAQAVMAPLETQVRTSPAASAPPRQHQTDPSASGELEERLAELGAQEDALNAQVRLLAREVGAIDAII
jgi:hypothetical protein